MHTVITYGNFVLDKQPLSRHGRSFIEFAFIGDLKPDRRVQSGNEQ